MRSEQKLTVGDSSEVIQAKRDVNIGLNYSQVREIFYDLFKMNFPQLVQEASKEAQINLEKYVNILIEKMKSSSDQIDEKKFQDPNIQFLLNESIKLSARKGEKIDLEILSELIITIVNKSTSDILETVAGEALIVTSKLTKEHIAFLTFLHYINYIVLQNIEDISQTEEASKNIIELSKISFDISEVNILHLTYIGVLIVQSIIKKDIYSIIRSNYGFYNNIANDVILEDIKNKAPSYYFLINNFIKHGYMGLNLTSVGRLIALANIKRVFPMIDYKIWIN